MSPRLFAIAVCLLLSGRWPKLRFVAVALVLEFVASACDTIQIAHTAPTLALAAWFGSSSVLVAAGAIFDRPWLHVVAASTLALVAMVVLALFVWTPLPIVCLASFLVALFLARSTTPRDVERSAILCALVGTFATSLLALFVGTDDAYAREVVSTSNQITHLAIAAIVLWATRR